MNWYIEIVKKLSIISALPAIWLGRKQRGYLWYYAWASFLADLLLSENICNLFPFINRIVCGLANLFFLCQLTILSLYLISQLSSVKLKGVAKTILFALVALFLASAGSDFLSKIFWKEQVFGHFFMMILCVLVLFKVIQNIEHQKIEKSPAFLFAACFLLFEAYSVLLFLFTDQFAKVSPSVAQNVWSVHNLLNIMTNLVIARIFYLQRSADIPPFGSDKL